MTIATHDDKKLKSLIKDAFTEALNEQRDLVREIVEETIEDIALARAIEQGLQGKAVTRDAIFKIIEGKS